MKFAENSVHFDLYLTDLSREPPPPLPDGHVLGEKLYFTGPSQTFSNGDRLDHGAEGEVTGPVPDGSPAEGKGMTVLFPGNKLGAQLFVSDLDLTMRSCMEEVD